MVGDREVERDAPLRHGDTAKARASIRDGSFQSQTSGLAPGKLQANLVILPEAHALDFMRYCQRNPMRYCQRNPKPCPLVGVGETGDPRLPTLGADIDVRTDLPAYNIYRRGVLVDSPTDIRDVWQEDFVAFALGCSFTFERALLDAGIGLEHVETNRTVSMYRTTIETRTAGPFVGGMVVSLRMIADGRVDDVVAISRQYPWAHGGPVHIGEPNAIGIQDLGRPDWGDSPSVPAGTTPVFWACGVTPQNAIRHAELPLCITHKPGRMLITDVDEMAEIPFV